MTDLMKGLREVGTTLLKYSFLLLVAASVWLLEYVLVHDPNPKDSMMAKLLEEIVIALGTAYVVIVVIEQPSLKEQGDFVKEYMKQVARNVFAAVYGIEPPRPVLEYIEEHFIKYPFREHRRSLFISLELDPGGTGENVFGVAPVKVAVSQSYYVTNVSKERRTYDILISCENVLLECLKRRGLNTKNYGKTRISIDGTTQDPQVDPESKAAKISIEIEPGSQCHIDILQEHLRLIHDTEIWICKRTVEDLTLNVRTPPELLMCGIATDPNTKELEFKDKYGAISRSITGPLFPGHGIILWWRPRAWDESAAADRQGELSNTALSASRSTQDRPDGGVSWPA